MNNILNNYNSIYAAFYQQVITTPDKTAVIFEEKIISYIELNIQVNKLCIHLNSKGIKSGDAIAVLLPNSYEYCVVLLAAAKLKLLLVPFNVGLPVSSILSSYKSLNIKYTISWFGLINEILSYDNTIHNSLMSVGDTDFFSGCKFEDIDNINIHNTEINKCSINDDAPFIICLSSGSTGNPKPIILSQKTKLKRIQALADNYSVDNNDITLAATPLYHSLAMRLVLQPLVMGGTSVILKSFSVDGWINSIKENNVSFTIAVSSQLKQISKRLDADKNDCSSLKTLVSSSEQLSLDVKEQLLNSLTCEFHECYGTSEIGIATNLLASNHSKLHSVGKAINGVDIVILDDEHNILKSNSIGEIACKTDMRFSGYLNLPDTTKNSFHNDYFLTGDLGCLDEDGYLYYKGRKKELIISGGINIYPKDIEDTIKNIEGVKEVAAIPKHDPILGEVVCAIIVKEPSTNVTLRIIKQHCAKHLADFQFPREFQFIESLPKNPLGKIQKHRISQDYFAKTA